MALASRLDDARVRVAAHVARTADDGRRDEPANPMYNGPRWFSCTAARRIKLKLHQFKKLLQ